MGGYLSLPTLTAMELECLRQLVGRAAWRSPTYPREVLAHLCALGFAERIMLNWMPLELPQYAYRATSQGSDYLATLDSIR